jgi:hypothetical protein
MARTGERKTRDTGFEEYRRGAARAGWSVLEVMSGQGWWKGQPCQTVTTLWDGENLWPAALGDGCERRQVARCRSGFAPGPDFYYQLFERPNGRPLLHFPPGTLRSGFGLS